MSEVAARYGVFGQPINHSLSPRIHAAFASQFGEAIDYRAMLADVDGFVDTLDAFAKGGGRGANVTLPLKQHAVGVCAQLSARAARCGSVNTLIRAGTDWHGDSTDGIGLLRDLEQRHGVSLQGRRALLLGAGGAARAAAFALLDAGVDVLVIVNRNTQRAQVLCADLQIPERVRSAAWSELADVGAFDLLINATAAGHDQLDLALPHSLLHPHSVAYDLSYGAAAQPFLRWARLASAAHVLDGLGMLVEQAAESHALWFGRVPQTAAIYDELRAELTRG